MNFLSMCAGAASSLIFISACAADAFYDIQAHNRDVFSVDFAHDGSDMVTASCWDQEVVIWDVKEQASKQKIKLLDDGDIGIHKALFSAPEHNQLAALLTDGSVIICDTRSSDVLGNLDLNGKCNSNGIVWHPFLPVVAFSNRHGGVSEWDTMHKNKVGDVDFGVYNVSCVDYNSDGAVQTGHYLKDGKSTFFIRDRNGEFIEEQSSEPFAWAVRCVPGNDSLVAAALNDGTIHLRNIITGKLERTLNGHVVKNGDCAIEALCFNPQDNTQLASGSDDKTVRVWDITSERCKVLQATAEVNCIAFHPDGKHLAAACYSSTNDNSGKVRIWNLARALAE